MSRFSTAMFLSVIGLLAAEVRAQDPGDVGSPECREVQLAAQAAVLAGEPYNTRGGPVRTAASVVDPAVRSGFITPECASCIMNQFARRIPIAQQRTCGPICGNAVCQRGEDPCSCPADCGTTCGACCLLDDSCIDQSEIECASAGGVHQGFGTNCASSQCCTPLGTGSCAVAPDCCDDNATCEGNTCCLRTGTTGCAINSDCCAGTFGGVICEAERCCALTGLAFHCEVDADCCNPNAICGDHERCCIRTGTTGCATNSDCCAGTFGGVICEAEKCCALTGLAFHCEVDADCCNPNAICGDHDTCCVPQFGSCTGDSDCCSGTTCVNGTCEGFVGP